MEYTRDRPVMVLSHWPLVAEQVPQLVAELVAELVSESFHTSRMYGNKSACPAASSIFSTYNNVTKAVHCVVEFHGYSLQPRSSSEQNMTSLGIPFSDWLNENVSQLVAELVSSVNLLSNMWLV